MISSQDILKQPSRYKDNFDLWDEFAANPYASKLPLVGKYLNAYNRGRVSTRVGANLINSLDEAGCFELLDPQRRD